MPESVKGYEALWGILYKMSMYVKQLVHKMKMLFEHV